VDSATILHMTMKREMRCVIIMIMIIMYYAARRDLRCRLLCEPVPFLLPFKDWREREQYTHNTGGKQDRMDRFNGSVHMYEFLYYDTAY